MRFFLVALLFAPSLFAQTVSNNLRVDGVGKLVYPNNFWQANQQNITLDGSQINSGRLTPDRMPRFGGVVSTSTAGSTMIFSLADDSVTASKLSSVKLKLYESLDTPNTLVALDGSGNPYALSTADVGIQFQNGTDAERKSVVFQPGVPVWTNDTKRLFVGDGSTLGGVISGDVLPVQDDTTIDEYLFGTGDSVKWSPVIASKIAMSDDVIWTPSPSPDNIHNWQRAAYGAGRFVALAGWAGSTDNRSAVAYATGTSWSVATIPNFNWYDVTYGIGMFVIVGQGSLDGGTGSDIYGAATSTDGVTWVQRTCPPGVWTRVAFGNGTFVAIAIAGSNRCMTSADGINWVAHTLPEDNFWSTPAYGNGMWVSVGGDGVHRVMTSPDGANWTPRNAVAANQWLSVAFGNGKFVAVSNTASSGMTSPDGITWTARTIPASSTVLFGNGTFLVRATTGDYYTSPDGITWTLIPSENHPILALPVASGGGKWLSLGGTDSGGAGNKAGFSRHPAPSLVGGLGISVSGEWPNQTVRTSTQWPDATGQSGVLMLGPDTPATGYKYARSFNGVGNIGVYPPDSTTMTIGQIRTFDVGGDSDVYHDVAIGIDGIGSSGSDPTKAFIEFGGVAGLSAYVYADDVSQTGLSKPVLRLVSVPGSATSPGKPGQVAASSTAFYVYIGNGTSSHLWLKTTGTTSW